MVALELGGPSSLLPRETKVVDWFRLDGERLVIPFVRIVGKDRLGNTYVQKFVGRSIERGEGGGDRSGSRGSSKVTAGVSRNSRGFSQRRQEATALFLSHGTRGSRGYRWKKKKEQNHGRLVNPQQRDRIKMCAEDVYVRRRGTARRATREFQPPLRRPTAKTLYSVLARDRYPAPCSVHRVFL